MALVITGGKAGDSASHIATGPTEVIASGTFDGAKVAVSVSAESAFEAPIVSLQAPSAVALRTAGGTNVQIDITGGGANAAIDVTCN